MRLVKILLVPAALAIAPAASFAATPPSGSANDEIRSGIEVTPAYHRHGYYHYYRPYPYYYRPYYRPYRYFYGPRCFWSHRYHRTICR